MARSAADLKALLMAGDDYRETITIEYLGELYAIEIRPLTEGEITDVERSMKVSGEMLKKIASKIKVGQKLTKSEEEKVTKEALDSVLADGSIDVGDMNYMSYIQDREYCKRGIVDAELAGMVLKFRYGLTEIISKRIQTISSVPPALIQNFFSQNPASS